MLQDRLAHSSPSRDQSWGKASTVLGGAAVLATVWLWLLSALADFNPPNWVRIVGLIWLPVGTIGALVSWTVARQGAGRKWGLVGVGLSGLAFIGFVGALVVLG